LKHLKREEIIFGLAGIVALAAFIWLGFERSGHIKELEVRRLRINDLVHENGELSDALTNAQAAIANFEEQIRSLSSTVGTLTKLRDTDPELLQKYSKVYFLSDNYTPRGLSLIDDKYVLDASRDLQFHSKAIDKLYTLLDVARSSGLDLYVASAYRSFDEQNDLKAKYKITYGAGTANTFSADQGYSEHQLGTTVDFTTQKIGGGLAGFDKTPEYKWLLDNAYKYGFALSYPEDNPYYVFEPWHWRFVGTELAQRLYEEKQHFVDLHQRQIDPYLLNLFN
jgi:LAS superfamily LD-carboxypeptidase LdcB